MGCFLVNNSSGPAAFASLFDNLTILFSCVACAGGKSCLSVQSPGYHPVTRSYIALATHAYLMMLLGSCHLADLTYASKFTHLYFSDPPSHEHGSALLSTTSRGSCHGVVSWMHGAFSPYGRLNPLECAQIVSCPPSSLC